LHRHSPSSTALIDHRATRRHVTSRT
jgi:hypothetical protein